MDTRDIDIDAFMVAAKIGDTDRVKLYLDNGMHVNQRHPRFGCTAIFFAVAIRRVDLIRLLLQRGADLSIREACDQTTLHTALSSAFRYSHRLTRSGNVDDIPHILDLLLTYGADVSVFNKEGATPLHMAMCGECPIEGLKIILDRIENSPVEMSTLNTFNRTGATALTHAICRYDLKKLELLLLAGADTDICNIDPPTQSCECAVMMAKRYEHGYGPARSVMTQLLSDVEDEFRYKCNQRVFAMGGHERSDRSLVQMLNPGILNYMFQRETVQYRQLSVREQLIQRIATKQLRIKVDAIQHV